MKPLWRIVTLLVCATTALAQTPAVDNIRAHAEKGEVEAQNTLGLAYRNGRGVPQDYALAAEWFQKAADKGNAAAQRNLGMLYVDGLGVKQDTAEAVKWLTKAAEQNLA